MSEFTAKAPFNDWWYWSDVLAKRLRTVADIYRENDERERADEMAGIAKKLYELFIGPARKGQKGVKEAAAKAALAKEEEDAIREAVDIWRDMLSTLPFVSQAMESYLLLQWRDIDPNPKKKDGDGKSDETGSGGAAAPAKKKQIDPRAVELFWGPKGRYDEGIRSGLAADGGLPGILMNYLVAEKKSSNRTPTEYKNVQEKVQYYGRDNKAKGPGMGGGF